MPFDRKTFCGEKLFRSEVPQPLHNGAMGEVFEVDNLLIICTLGMLLSLAALAVSLVYLFQTWSSK